MKLQSPFIGPAKINSWVLLAIFMGVNALLSYSPLPFPWKLMTGVIGLAFPLAWSSLRCWRTPEPRPLFFRESFDPPVALWVLVVLGALGFRFFRLNSFLGFPIYDEALNGFYAMGLARHWTWSLFFSPAQLPPLYIWILALAFKVAGPSLSILWLEPALFSLLAAGLAYFSARTFFSKSFSFWMLLFVSISFWPVFVGRFAHQGGMMLCWEWAALLAFGSWVKSGDPLRKTSLFLLGICVGIGFYTYVEWVLVAAILSLAVAAFLAARGKNRWRSGFTVYAAAVFLTILPLLAAALQEGYGRYLAELFILNPRLHPAGSIAPRWWDNFTVLFWGTSQRGFSYGPAWGGFLNPVLGGLVLLGLLELVRSHPHAVAAGWAAAFLAGFIPILFSNHFNGFHLVSLAPLALFAAALGFQRLYLDSGSRGRRLLFVLLLFSAVLDGTHLMKSSWEIKHDEPILHPPEYVQAWERLKAISRKMGPGLFFSSFTVDEVRPPFLEVATASFNGVVNPKIPLKKCSWAAVLTNVGYQPFLNRRFAVEKSYWLSKDHPPPDGGRMLWVTALTPSSLPVFLHWKQAAKALQPFQEINSLKANGSDVGAFLGPVLGALAQARPFFQGDPFLASSYWERVADLRFQTVLLEAYQKATGLGLSEMPSGPVPLAGINIEELKGPIGDLEKAIQEGYPAAHLYFHLGLLWEMSGRPAQARRAFSAATLAPLDFTASRRYLNNSFRPTPAVP